MQTCSEDVNTLLKQKNLWVLSAAPLVEIIITAVQCDLKEFTLEPVSPGIPRPPSTPARPYKMHNPVKIGFAL